MTIRLLSQNLINQIAAGEVIERPSSVIKELIENSIDAGASEISVSIIDAGKSFISIEDNGSGMDKESLEMCVMSHATSKLTADNLFDIHTFGFRGEALPSIASISRVSISSAQTSSSESWRIQLEGQNNLGISPANRKTGTTIEVRDLFFATPARLKFLKSDSYESDSCQAVFHRMALAFHDIGFRFFDSNKEKLHYEKANDLGQRIRDIFGEEFFKNLFEINVEKDSLKLHGFVGVPTFNKAAGSSQYFFVNNRYVKDKTFASALRSAYAGLVPQGRYPVAIVFLNVPYDEVDVNAHPAKVEIRFRDSDKIRLFLASELKMALASYGASVSATHAPMASPSSEMYARAVCNADAEAGKGNGGNNVTLAARTQPSRLLNNGNFSVSRHPEERSDVGIHVRAAQAFTNAESAPASKIAQAYVSEGNKKENESNVTLAYTSEGNKKENESNVTLAYVSEGNKKENESNVTLAYVSEGNKKENGSNVTLAFGDALTQIGNTYIIAENADGLVIVDQHAAAERITLEKLKRNLSLESQNLLIPEVCNMTESNVELLEMNNDLLVKFGIYVEKLSNDLVVVNAVPAILETCDAKSLILDIVDELSTFGDAYTIDEKINKVLSTISCHGSLRAGKTLTIQEMNCLLRQMEKTLNIAQCCHGRPSYITIDMKKLNKFFERS
ncbi:DNA mismatch repair protein MutL [Alphaproteobacteria bacterium]|nr:DNA mismatch repair protein MutL [Alphaproteobacteria bacterium]